MTSLTWSSGTLSVVNDVNLGDTNPNISGSLSSDMNRFDFKEYFISILDDPPQALIEAPCSNSPSNFPYSVTP